MTSEIVWYMKEILFWNYFCTCLDKEDVKPVTMQSPDDFDAFSFDVSVMPVSEHLSCLLIFFLFALD